MRIIQSEHPRPLGLLAVGPGGLVVAASDRFGVSGGAKAWDASTGAPAWSIASRLGGFRCLAFLLGGDYLFVADFDGERLFSLPAAGEPAEESRTKWSTESTAAGDRVLVARGGAAPALTFWGVPDMGLLWKRDREDRWDGNPHFGSCAISPTGGLFALSVHEGATHPKQLISVRYTATGAPRVAIPFDAADPVLQLAFTADGSKVVARTHGRIVHLFDAHNGMPASQLVHPGRPYVTGIAVHPGGAVACVRTDGTVTFWDAGTRAKIRAFDWKAGKLLSLAFSPDGALAAAGTEDGKVIVWDVDL